MKPTSDCSFSETQLAETFSINGLNGLSLHSEYQLPHSIPVGYTTTNLLQTLPQPTTFDEGTAGGCYVLHNPDVQYACRHCHALISCTCQLKLHEILNHTSTENGAVLICHLCSKKFSRTSAFRGHLQFHDQNDQSCPRCQRLVSQVKPNDEKTIPTSSNQYRCRLCGTENHSFGELSSHYRLKHPKKTVSCDPTDDPLNAIDSSLEASVGDRSCKIRGCRRIKEVISASTYKKRQSATESVLQQSCTDFDVTDKIEKIAVAKKRHMFVCKICKKKIRSFPSAKTHVLTHYGVKPFVCPVCMKSFTQKSSVDTHMAIHNAKQHLSCPFCAKTFTFKVNLTSHLAKCHKQSNVDSPIPKKRQGPSYSFVISYRRIPFAKFTETSPLFFLFASFGNRRYPCRYCFRTFTSPSVLHTHQLLHLSSPSYTQLISEKLAHRVPFKDRKACPHCSRVFANCVDASRHLQHHRLRRRCQLTTISHFIGLFFNNLTDTSYCPCCSKYSYDSRSRKLHFVSHFVAEAFCCPSCPRRFNNPTVCRRHEKREHSPKKRRMSVLLRYDLPIEVQRRIARTPIPAPRKLASPIPECVNYELESTAAEASSHAHLEEAPIISGDFIQLNGAPIEGSATTFTEQLGEELVWVTAPYVQDHSTAVYMLPPPPPPQQPQEVHHMAFDPEIHSGDVFYLQSGETLEEQYSINDTAMFYGDPVNFVEVPVYDNTFQSANIGPLEAASEVVSIPAGNQTALMQPGYEIAVSLPEFYGCSQCTERFTEGSALLNHSLSHPTETRYSVCMACGGMVYRAADSMEVCGDVVCDACGRTSTFQHMETILIDDAIAATPYYCTHCNLGFGEIEQLDAHVSDITSYQNKLDEPRVIKQPLEKRPKRRPNAQNRQNRVQLPEVEVQNVVQSQLAKDASLSERMLHAAACERGVRSYPTLPSNPECNQKLGDYKERSHICTVCLFRFKRSSDLHRHMFLHTGNRPYGCRFCERRFILPRRMLAHATRAHGEAGASWATEYLSRRPRARKFALNYPGSKSSSAVTCHVCRAVFSSASSLRQHIRIHTDTRIYACSNCSETFRTPVQRKRHMEGCSPSRVVALVSPPPTPFGEQQPNAYKELVVPSRLPATKIPESQKYIRLEEPAVGADRGYTSFWQCRKCGSDFVTSRDFSRHNCSELTEPICLEKPVPARAGAVVERSTGRHVCPTCGKVFPRPTELRRHARTHSGEKPFSCEICGATFSQSGSLSIHRRRHEIDGGERSPFRCRVCSATFLHESNVLRHMKQMHPHDLRTPSKKK